MDVYSSEVREPFKPRRPALRDRAAGSCPRPPARGAQREPRPCPGLTEPGGGLRGRRREAEGAGAGPWPPQAGALAARAEPRGAGGAFSAPGTGSGCRCCGGGGLGALGFR